MDVSRKKRRHIPDDECAQVHQTALHVVERAPLPDATNGMLIYFIVHCSFQTSNHVWEFHVFQSPALSLVNRRKQSMSTAKIGQHTTNLTHCRRDHSPIQDENQPELLGGGNGMHIFLYSLAYSFLHAYTSIYKSFFVIVNIGPTETNLYIQM